MTDPIAALAVWLAGHVEWMRHRAEADEFLAAVDACARVMRGIARGPAEQKYLGPCGAMYWPTEYDSDVPCPIDGEMVNKRCWSCGWERRGEHVSCEGDVYASRGSRTGRCRVCGAEVSTGDREAWLDGEVRSRAFRAAEIEDAYGVKADLIRQWAKPERGILTVHGHDARGRALYLLGDVLEIAAARKARQATEQAKRARRAAVKAAETDERMTA